MNVSNYLLSSMLALNSGVFIQEDLINPTDRLISYFHEMGSTLKVDETKNEKIFSDNFQMIINGKLIVNGRDKLTPHFELIFSQVSRIEFNFHERIETADKTILRYTISSPEKGNIQVIAIFKFREGKIYEMNEVVHLEKKENPIDYSSK